MRLNAPLPVAALIGLLLLSATSAQAATNTYTFSGALDFGKFKGETFSGQFSFDDASLVVNSVNLSFLNETYTETNADATPEAAFANGTFLGLSFTVESSDPTFSLVPGFSSVADAYFGYTPSTGISGFGSVTYTLMPVPEPETYAMLLAGLGLVGWAARRNRSLTVTRKKA